MSNVNINLKQSCIEFVPFSLQSYVLILQISDGSTGSLVVGVGLLEMGQRDKHPPVLF